MALLEGSKSVSTSIGGSTQTVNFNPVFNARGASSGTIANQGATSSISPNVTTTQAPGGDSESLAPRLGLPSFNLDETPNRGYVSPTSFAPGALPSEAARASVLAGEVGGVSTSLLLALGVAALALLMVWR